MKNEETGGARDPLQDIEKGKKERGFRVIWGAAAPTESFFFFAWSYSLW